MNVNKKLDRLKQWAGERMGGEVKTSVSDDFKSLEIEMGLRHEGMEKIHKSMTSYVKALSKRNEGEDREKTLPVGRLGSTMIAHGEDFEDNSEYGQCLIAFGRVNERIARLQETYVNNATSSWLESLERSLAQMKEYQAARKKLEQRRLAYDTSLTKMQKAKREDFRVEEELRSQKAKYEEASDDVYRRMQDIKEAETETVTDLGAFLDSELAYYEKCREALLVLKAEWPAGSLSTVNSRVGRSRSNTAHSFQERYIIEEEPGSPPSPDSRPSIRPHRAVSNVSAHGSYSRPESPAKQVRPDYARSMTFEGPTQLRRDPSAPEMPRITRVPSDTLTIRSAKSQLRPVSLHVPQNQDVFNDQDDSAHSESPDRFTEERSVSPATSYGSVPSRSFSASTLSVPGAKKGPPPPPPSRAKKPPPPPPAKRGVMT